MKQDRSSDSEMKKLRARIFKQGAVGFYYSILLFLTLIVISLMAFDGS